MLKLTLLFRRAPHVTADEFLAHWRDVHIPLVVQIPGIVRYVISPVLSSPDASEPPFDGMAELYFGSEATLAAALASPETQATAVDGRKFIARGSIVRLVQQEEQILPAAGAQGAAASQAHA